MQCRYIVPTGQKVDGPCVSRVVAGYEDVPHEGRSGGQRGDAYKGFGSLILADKGERSS